MLGPDHDCYVVSGCGDGGLIDALRIGFKFYRGETAFPASMLRKADFIEAIRNAEENPKDPETAIIYWKIAERL